jgi:hypothetical protein
MDILSHGLARAHCGMFFYRLNRDLLLFHDTLCLVGIGRLNLGRLLAGCLPVRLRSVVRVTVFAHSSPPWLLNLLAFAMGENLASACYGNMSLLLK